MSVLPRQNTLGIELNFKFIRIVITMKHTYLIKLSTFLLLSFMYSSNLYAYNWGGNLVVVNDYIGKRGISLTDKKPALQAEISVNNDSGFYAGLWGSNVEFDEVRAEVDVFTGILHKVSANWALGAGVFHYENIGDKSQNFQDIFVNVVYDKNTMIRYNYSEDFSGIGDSSLFLELQHSHQFKNEIKLQANLNRQNFKYENVLEDFNILRVSISKKSGKSNLSLAYSNTDSDDFAGRADAAVILAYQLNW